MPKSDLLFLLVLATLPLQLNKFFFPDYSYVLGIPIDYLAIAIYLSDLAIIAYLTAFIIENYRKLPAIFTAKKSIILALAALAIVSWSLFPALKILQMAVLAVFASVSFSRQPVTRLLGPVLGLSLVWQAIVIMLQFALGRSLGLSFLGERSFDITTSGIAHIELFGRQFLRPYGTFPHPNVAAAFLVIGTIMTSDNFKVTSRLARRITLLFTVFSVVATFSKAALAALAISALFLFAKARYFLIGLLVLAVLTVLSFKAIPEQPTASVAERLVLIKAALEIAAKNPLLGVGSGQFIPQLAELDLTSLAQIRLLQPVHNVFLLILAENGLIGLFLFAAVLFATARRINSPPKLALYAAILIFLSVDHYLWTLHQGKMLLWLSLGYILSNRR